MRRNEYLDTELLDALDIGMRALNALQREGVTTIRHLLGFSRAELLSIRWIGRKSIRKVEELLEKNGLTLRKT